MQKEQWNLVTNELIPHTVTVDVLPRGWKVKVPLNYEPEPIAPEREKGKHLLLLQVLRQRERRERHLGNKSDRWWECECLRVKKRKTVKVVYTHH